MNLNVDELKNKKQLGEIGERIAIGELSKYGIDILLPMSDNLPFDFIIYNDKKFYKCQVKTTISEKSNDLIKFSLTSNNWYKKTIHKYNSSEIDIMICCDLNTIYLFPECDLDGKTYVSLRTDKPINNQSKGVKFKKDYVISEERLEYTFNKVNEFKESI